MSKRFFFNCIFPILCSCAVFAAAVPFSALASDEPPVTPVEQSVSEIVRLDLPVVTDNGVTPFDFHIDPQMLIYVTDAARYGGGKVEEGATLLFRNTEGDYDFSSRSDYLTLTNRGDAPIIIHVNAEIENLGEIEMTPDPYFAGLELPALYLAIVDDNGTEASLSEYMDVSYSFELPANDSYSFGLTGACNADADWSRNAVAPVVRVTWQIEVPEKKEAEEESLEDGTEKPEFDLYQETLPTEPYGETVPEENPEGGTTDNPEASTQKNPEANTEGTTEGPVPAGNAGSSATSDAGKPVGTETQTGSTQGGNSYTGATEDNHSQTGSTQEDPSQTGGTQGGHSQTGGAQNNSSQESVTTQNTSGEGSVSKEPAAPEGTSN